MAGIHVLLPFQLLLSIRMPFLLLGEVKGEAKNGLARLWIWVEVS
jgi:hypothetical protein